MKSAVLTISGMTCEHCVSAICAALRNVPGTRDVEVTMGEVRVRYDDGCNFSTLIDAVRSAGYGVTAFAHIASAHDKP
jgi:copper chaperone